MRRYFSRMHKEKGSGRTLGVDPFLRDSLCFFLNPRINKDIITFLSLP